MITIDGSEGEGGGQVLRSSLTLSLFTGEAFRMTAIRARRSRPGLLRQHLTAVDAARAISDAEVDGAALGSSSLVFRPRRVRPGAYAFAVGTAGSATLVLQTILLPLVLADAASEVTLEGGTHNPAAPPYPFLEASYLPLLARMGAPVEARLERPGFYPAGGGRFSVSIAPGKLDRLDLTTRGALVSRTVRALVADLPRGVATREIDALLGALGWSAAECDARPDTIRGSAGPGNALVVTLVSEHVTEVVVAFGERGVRAEDVAAKCAREVTRYLRAEVPVGEHLADQLLLPLALGGGGSFRTLAPSGHLTTHAGILRAFLGTTVELESRGADDVLVHVPARR